MTYFASKTAVITGAASGIGRSLAIHLADRGANLALCDVDHDGLAETATILAGRDTRVFTAVVDVSRKDDIYAFANDVAAHFDQIHHVINNAGVAHTGYIEELEDETLYRVMDINFWGMVHSTRAFLPQVISSGAGHIVNISSLFGLLAVPSQGAYNASKFAIRGFTEALAMEMKLSGHPVRVSSVHPGGIATNIVRSSTHSEKYNQEDLVTRFDRIAITSPDKAATVIAKGMERGKSRILIGPDAKAVDILVRIAGPRYQNLAARLSARNGL